VSETIPIVFVPGDRDVGVEPSPATLARYRAKFGCDFFGFWYGGLRCLIVNSSLLCRPAGAPEDAALQEKWLEEEVEQAKLCSAQVAIFSHHPWFVDDAAEDSATATATAPDAASLRVVPKAVRQKWLARFRHSKVRFLLSGRAYGPDGGGDSLRAVPVPAQGKKCFPRNRVVSAVDAAGSTVMDDMEMINLDGDDEEGAAAAVEEDDDDEEGKEAADDDAATAEDDEEWLNEDTAYDGPTQLVTAPLGLHHGVAAHHPAPANGTSGTPPGPPAATASGSPWADATLRVVKVYEHSARQESFPLSALPATIAL